jgi:hypothetical protein
VRVSFDNHHMPVKIQSRAAVGSFMPIS